MRQGFVFLPYSRASSLFFDVPLALLPSKADEIRIFWESKLSGAHLNFEDHQEPFAVRHLSLPEIFGQMDEPPDAELAGEPVRRQGKVAVIPLHGVISQRMNLMSAMSGGTSTEMFGEAFNEQVNDPQVRAIVIDIDSPGGSTYGVAELAAQILAARSQKPILAVANSVAASAAYWLGSAAGRFYSTEGGLVGSIGVYMMHVDASKWAENEGLNVRMISAGKNKTRGNEWEPLSEEDVSHFQMLVDYSYTMFIRDVARGRGVPEATVRGGYGEGDVFPASGARKAGMVDGIKTLNEVITEAASARIRPLVAGQAVTQDTETRAEADEEGKKILGRMALRRIKDRSAAAGAA